MSVLATVFCLATQCQGELQEEALAAAKKATTFLTDQISTEGGYLWRYSADLQLREGEGIVDTRTIWIQPPGTPTVGEAFLHLYEATGDKQFLDAARSAGEALRLGQMRSGGWQAMIEFEPERRKKWAYRTEKLRKKTKDQSSLDDDKTQSALRFAMKLDQALKFQDAAIHEMVTYGLNGLLNKGQMRNGAFPQVWTNDNRPLISMQPASYPDAWPRSYPGHQEYWYRPTLNDNLAPDVIRTLLLAETIYNDDRYRKAAIRLADFLLLAQMPEPQPAWAQQYSFDMQPMWARKFEPPAITGGESQGVLETLMDIYAATGNKKYLVPIPKALDYLKRSELPNGRLARFYELKSNRPLYFTKDYKLTYDDSDVPTHYSFSVSSRVDKLRRRYEKLLDQTTRRGPKTTDPQAPNNETMRTIVQSLDERGAWVADGKLRYHKKRCSVIEIKTTVANLESLAAFLAASKPQLWNSSVPIPKTAELESLSGTTFHVIKRHEPDRDGFDWLHGVALAWHKNRLYATFGHNTGAENTATEVAHSCFSEDHGATWSPVTLIDDGDQEGAVSHGVLVSTGGQLWAFHGSFHGTLQGAHTRAYVLDESTGSWIRKGPVVLGGFWPMDTPRRMDDGNWIMAGIRIKDGNGGQNDPAAVAISHGDDFTKWDLVVVPKDTKNDMWGESTLLVDGPDLLNIARYRRPVALLARSRDFGRTWTKSTSSNLPMVASKPFAGILSNGSRYLICTTTADSGNRRSPLTIALAQPGETTFQNVFRIRGSFSSGPGESNHNVALAYPYAVEHNHKLYVAYSNDGGRGANRNSAELAIIPVESLITRD